MSGPIVYLDNSATTRVCDEAARKVMEAMTETYGNPSSLHTMGIEAEKMLREARRNIASGLQCEETEIYFTSGGTEANNLAVLGAARALKRRGNRVVTTDIEHSSVEGPSRLLEKEGFEVVRLKPGEDGCVSERQIADAVTKDTVLVSLMYINNETGAVQPVEAAKRAVERSGGPALIHCDAVQAYGKIPIRPKRLGFDLMSFSSHKIHGPKGAGALFIRKGVRILPLISGGGQERLIRPGTEPLPAIAGFGEAARVAAENLAENADWIYALNDRCRRRLAEVPGLVINSAQNAAPHILNVSVTGIRSETMLHFLSSRNIFLSSGSACSRGARSRVLAAMNLPDSRIDSALRISFSRYNSEDDIDLLVEGLREGVRSLARFE